MRAEQSIQNREELLAWRTRTLNTLLIILVVIYLPAMVASIINALRVPENWTSAILYSVAFVTNLCLVVFRTVSSRLRAWGLLLLGYFLATAVFANYGLNSAGPWYLLALPIVALILIGVRAGILATVFSAVDFAVILILQDQGVLVPVSRLSSPFQTTISFLVILTAVMALLILFYRFQVRIIADQHSTAEELRETRALLEEQNQTLEERIAQRTTDLEQSTVELKESAYQLEESRRRLADIINFLPDAVLVIDQDDSVVAWNHAIEEMTGIQAAEMLGKGGKGRYEYALPFYGERRPILIDLVTMVHQDLDQHYAQVHWDGDILVGETYVPQLRGKESYLMATAAALHDSQGNVVGAIEVIRDITERKHAEEALQKSEELYRSVVNNSIDTYFRLDGQGNVVLTSPSGAGLLGYDSPSDMIGLNITRDFFADPNDRIRFLAEIQKTGSIKDFEAPLSITAQG